LVHIQSIINWARLLKKSAGFTVALLTSLCVLVYLFTHFHDRINGSPSNTGSDYEVWSPPATCQDCFLSKPIDLGLLEQHLLLVLIHAKADDRTRRDAIRQTWVSDYRGLLNPPVQYRFVIGAHNLGLEELKRLLAESERFGDVIIMDDIPDSEADLTRRTLDSFSLVLQTLKFKYILKCDDDTFVDLPRIATELQRRQYHARFYWGFIMGHNKVHSYGRYKEVGWSLCDFYLPYAAGGGYVISRDLVELLHENRDSLKRYSCEDVSLGAWLAPYNIERRHDTRFNTESRSRGCKSVFMVSHKVSAGDMFQMYESLQLDGTLCAASRQWYSYDGFIYNWTISTDHCCRRKYGVP
jgi:galactosylxylosylprotein 3-beta-galactosyltransferase